MEKKVVLMKYRNKNIDITYAKTLKNLLKNIIYKSFPINFPISDERRKEKRGIRIKR